MSGAAGFRDIDALGAAISVVGPDRYPARTFEMTECVRHRALGNLHDVGDLRRCTVAAEAGQVIEHRELRECHRVGHDPLEGRARELGDDADLVQEAEHRGDVIFARGTVFAHALLIRVSKGQRGPALMVGP